MQTVCLLRLPFVSLNALRSASHVSIDRTVTGCAVLRYYVISVLSGLFMMTIYDIFFLRLPDRGRVAVCMYCFLLSLFE